MQLTSRISSKGQVTIPKVIRNYFDWTTADELFFTIFDEQSLTIKIQKKDFLDLAGTVSPKKKPEDFRNVRKKVLSNLSQKNAREK